jgi:hypothetical protein
MLRVLYAGVFLVGLACAVACGRQVTPNPTLSGLSGEIILKFRTAATPNFALYNYFVAFNTTGSGQEPYAVGFQNGQFKNFSYSIVTGALTQNTALPLLIQYYFRGSTVAYRTLNFNPATTQLNLETATTTAYSEFQIVFQRAQLALPPPTATTPPASPTPTPKATRATPTPTASPTPTPGSGSGSGSQPTPVSSPTTAAQSTWCINLFITGLTSQSGEAQVYDALGLGAGDHSFSSGCFDVNQYLDKVITQPLESQPPVDPASQLAGFELINFP